MTDQISSTVGVASGFPVASLAPGAAEPAPVRSGSAKNADPAQSVQDGSVLATPAGSPDQAVQQINNHLQQASSKLQVQVDSETGKTIYKVVDPTTGQVVLQVPSAGVLAMARSLQSMDSQQGASGFLLDKKG